MVLLALMPGNVPISVKLGGGLILLTGVFLAGTAKYFDQRYNENIKRQQELYAKMPKPTVTSDPVEQPTPTPQVKVVVEGGERIPAATREDLQNKVISPVLDYYAQATGSAKIITFELKENSGKNKTDYPFLASVVFADESELGFVVELKKEGFSWWIPECLNKCEVTEEFAKKYPEIVSKL